MTAMDRLRSLTPRAQLLTAALVLVAITAGLAVVYLLALRPAYGVLFSNLRGADAAAIVADLDKRKAAYRLKDGGATILVPQDVVDQTRLSILSEDLPLKSVVGFEIFGKSDMGLTEFAQNINYRRALQGELARTIMALDGVDSARVHLTLAEPSAFRDDRRPSKASVTIIPRLGRTLPAGAIRGVQRLVAAAVPDLEPGDVVVLDERGEEVDGAGATIAGAAPPSVSARQAVEDYYASRVRRALAPLLADDVVRVSVAATGTGADLGSDPFGDWSPERRAFPLAVNLSVSEPLGPHIRDEVQAAALAAIAPGPAGLDRVMLAAVPLAEAAPPRATAAPRTPPPRPATPALSGPAWFWAPILLPALALALALLVMLRRPRRLSPRLKARYVQQLSAYLEQEGADGHRNA